MNNGADDGTAGRRRAWMLPVSLLLLALTVIALDAPVWAQAVLLASAAGTAAMLLHRQDHPTAEIERKRPDMGVPLEERLVGVLRQRPVARRAVLGIGAVAIGVGTLALRRFGPQPRAGTAWTAGRRLVTNDGDALRPEDVPEGGVVTVWPEGSIDVELAATMLLRLREPPREPTRVDHVVDGALVAYSRICTHAGCPVALYRDWDQSLFCPCHQATFDAGAGARPIFGPASRALPQLPLGLDDQGFLVALDDYATLPGPPGGGP